MISAVLLLALWCQGAWSLSSFQVRFINTPDGNDVVATARTGEYLLNVGDENGIQLPRACRNGLCGSCVCDVIEADGSSRTIRACNTKLSPPPRGQEQLVVDVYRLAGGDDDVMESSMKRFSDDWETSFVPDYKKESAVPVVGGEYSQPEEWTTYERVVEPDTTPGAGDDARRATPILHDDPGAAPWDRICCDEERGLKQTHQLSSVSHQLHRRMFFCGGGVGVGARRSILLLMTITTTSFAFRPGLSGARKKLPSIKTTTRRISEMVSLGASVRNDLAVAVDDEPQKLASRRLLKTASVLLLPCIGAGILAYFTFGPLCQLLRQCIGLEALDVLSNDQGQFLQNFLGVIGILFSLLIGNTYSFCYNQQVMIYMSFFEEISVAKALLEQISLVCRGRPYYDLVLKSVEDYIDNDLRRVDLPPAVVLSSKPKDDPLEQIMWMTSVGTPSVVYDTVKWLRQARGARLGAVQRKLPPLHFLLLFVLAIIELSAFPLLSAGAAETVGTGILTVESAIFALMAASVVLTLGVVLQLWRPSGSVYSVDSALAVMLDGLRDELKERRKGLKPRAATDLPAPAYPR